MSGGSDKVVMPAVDMWLPLYLGCDNALAQVAGEFFTDFHILGYLFHNMGSLLCISCRAQLDAQFVDASYYNGILQLETGSGDKFA